MFIVGFVVVFVKGWKLILVMVVIIFFLIILGGFMVMVMFKMLG